MNKQADINKQNERKKIDNITISGTKMSDEWKQKNKNKASLYAECPLYTLTFTTLQALLLYGAFVLKLVRVVIYHCLVHIPHSLRY